jgi:hypothetical protein
MENEELVSIPKEQIELMLLQANIELIQKVAKLIEILEKK